MKQFSFACGIVLAIILTGCSGTMEGVVRRDARRVAITYTDSRVGKGTLSTVLPGGERFEGRLTKLSSDPAASASASTVAIDNAGSFEALESFYGNTEAVLYGDKGNVMKCRFKLTDTVIGLASGGFGLCQVSDGRVIDVFL